MRAVHSYRSAAASVAWHGLVAFWWCARHHGWPGTTAAPQNLNPSSPGFPVGHRQAPLLGNTLRIGGRGVKLAFLYPSGSRCHLPMQLFLLRRKTTPMAEKLHFSPRNSISCANSAGDHRLAVLTGAEFGATSTNDTKYPPSRVACHVNRLGIHPSGAVSSFIAVLNQCDRLTSMLPLDFLPCQAAIRGQYPYLALGFRWPTQDIVLQQSRYPIVTDRGRRCAGCAIPSSWRDPLLPCSVRP